MGNDFYLIDIVIYALIAVFLIYRLRNVLGTKHGEERRRSPFQKSKNDPDQTYAKRSGDAADENVILIKPPALEGLDKVKTSKAKQAQFPETVAGGIANIQQFDPYFGEQKFLKGAEQAFEMILTAFAESDFKTLKMLLSEDVYQRFSDEIDRRQQAGQRLITEIRAIDMIDIVKANVEEFYANIVVRIRSQQINQLLDKGEEPSDDVTQKPEERVDLWTFKRDLRSKNPNWILSETRDA